jgi:flagellar basal body rod protein FlgC
MEVQPGVTLKEFKDKKHQKDDPESVRVNGGDYISVDKSTGTRLMTTQQYAEMSDVRIYDRDRNKLNKKFDPEDTANQQKMHVKVLEMNVAEEVTETLSHSSSKQSHHFTKTH